jgi:hypothetical protein
MYKIVFLLSFFMATQIFGEAAKPVAEAVNSGVQSNIATFGFFLFSLAMFFFFESIFALRGIFRFIGAGVAAWLFYNYWDNLLAKIAAVLLIFGLEPV